MATNQPIDLPKGLLHDVEAPGLWHAIEAGGSTHGVGSHVLEDQPVASLQSWQKAFLDDAIQTITSRTPQAALVQGLIQVFLGLFKDKRWSLGTFAAQMSYDGDRLVSNFASILVVPKIVASECD